jgi:hypothetical protein
MRERFNRRPGGRKGWDGGLEGRGGRIGIFRGISLEVIVGQLDFLAMKKKIQP